MKKTLTQPVSVLTSEKLNTKVLIVTSGFVSIVSAICALWNPILLVFAVFCGLITKQGINELKR